MCVCVRKGWGAHACVYKKVIPILESSVCLITELKMIQFIIGGCMLLVPPNPCKITELICTQSNCFG